MRLGWYVLFISLYPLSVPDRHPRLAWPSNRAFRMTDIWPQALVRRRSSNSRDDPPRHDSEPPLCSAPRSRALRGMP